MINVLRTSLSLNESWRVQKSSLSWASNSSLVTVSGNEIFEYGNVKHPLTEPWIFRLKKLVSEYICPLNIIAPPCGPSGSGISIEMADRQSNPTASISCNHTGVFMVCEILKYLKYLNKKC